MAIGMAVGMSLIMATTSKSCEAVLTATFALMDSSLLAPVALIIDSTAKFDPEGDRGSQSGSAIRLTAHLLHHGQLQRGVMYKRGWCDQSPHQDRAQQPAAPLE